MVLNIRPGRFNKKKMLRWGARYFSLLIQGEPFPNMRPSPWHTLVVAVAAAVVAAAAVVVFVAPLNVKQQPHPVCSISNLVIFISMD